MEKIKSPHDLDRSRRVEHRDTMVNEFLGQERRAQEKVHEILKDQGNASDNDSHRNVSRKECGEVARHSITEIMSGRVAVLSFDDTLLTVQGIFSSVRFRHLPVVDEDGNIIGIISDRDFLRMVSPFYGTINEQTRDVEIMTRKVGMVMTRNPICVHTGYSILDAIKLMTGKKISCLPVVEPGTSKLQGIVTWKDIVRAFCPDGFTIHDSSRLKTGVHINPQSSESSRLKAKSAESARLRAVAGAVSADRYSDRDADRLQRNRPDPGQTEPAGSSRRLQGPPGPGPAYARRIESDTERISLSADNAPKIGEPAAPGGENAKGARLPGTPGDGGK